MIKPEASSGWSKLIRKDWAVAYPKGTWASVQACQVLEVIDHQEFRKTASSLPSSFTAAIASSWPFDCYPSNHCFAASFDSTSTTFASFEASYPLSCCSRGQIEDLLRP